MKQRCAAPGCPYSREVRFPTTSPAWCSFHQECLDRGSGYEPCMPVVTQFSRWWGVRLVRHNLTVIAQEPDAAKAADYIERMARIGLVIKGMDPEVFKRQRNSDGQGATVLESGALYALRVEREIVHFIVDQAARKMNFPVRGTYSEEGKNGQRGD